MAVGKKFNLRKGRDFRASAKSDLVKKSGQVRLVGRGRGAWWEVIG